jgi:adenylate cyclase class 2
MYEVEMKFPLDDPSQVSANLRQLGFVPGATHRQIDRYFNHPARDFASTDEALRLRLDDDRLCITYKGPKIDAQTKTREEIEVAVGGEENLEALSQILRRLGFRDVATVEKRRTYWSMTQESKQIEICMDEVKGVGWYVELETSAQEDELDAARDVILYWARQLGLQNSERRSYLELLLSAATHD